MATKIFGGWLLAVSFGTFGALTFGEYMRLRNYGINFSDHKHILEDFPKSEAD